MKARLYGFVLTSILVLLAANQILAHEGEEHSEPTNWPVIIAIGVIVVGVAVVVAIPVMQRLRDGNESQEADD